MIARYGWRANVMVLAMGAVVAAMLALSCIARPPEPVKPVVIQVVSKNVAPPAQRLDGRLPELAVPLRYELSLDIDPRTPRFFGRVKIDVSIQGPTSVLVMHAQHLSVRSVSIRTGNGQVYGTSRMRAENGAKTEELVLTFPSELPAGPAELALAYDAPFGSEPEGLFRVEEAGRWYAFTQFEPCAARRAFPSFDEPSFKAPFDISVTTPAGMVAFSNMPESSRTASPGEVHFRFAPSPPLPTYLVAVAVGDFDVNVGPATPVPIRLIRAKGKSGDANAPLQIAHELLGIFSNLFASPYPFPKLDLVAVPHFWDGAMENAGLITFKDHLLLPAHERSPAWHRRSGTLVLAHELAHQWFGDLVTPRWWNDMWLNEGFATFLEVRGIERWRPTFDAGASQLWMIEDAMVQDQSPSSTPVRAPVVTPEEANTALNSSKSVKAAGVLAMLERFVGEEVFWRAIRQYLKAHAWKTVSTDDFVSSLETASGVSLAGFVQTFLDQSGVPQVNVTQQCVRSGPSSLRVEQDAFRLFGAKGGERPPLWSIPFCGSAGASREPSCQALTGRSTELTLSVAPPCPVFYDPNPGLSGYYRYNVTAEQLALAGSNLNRLTRPTKFALLVNAWATVRQHRLAPDALLRFIETLDGEGDSTLSLQVASIFFSMADTFIDDKSERRFNDYVASRFAKEKARLELVAPSGGFLSLGRHRAAEDDQIVTARATFAWWLGNIGDNDVLAACDTLAREWVANPSEAIDPDAGEYALDLGARHLNARDFDRLAAEFEHPASPRIRELALTMLGNVKHPVLVRQSLELALRLDLTSFEASDLLFRLTVERTTRQVVYQWIAVRWGAIHQKWHGTSMRPIWQVVRFACDDEQRELLESTFKSGGVSGDSPFGQDAKWYEELRDIGGRCSELRKYGRASVARYLRPAVVKPSGATAE